MKKIILIGILIGLFVACKDKQTKTEKINTPEIAFTKDAELYFTRDKDTLKQIDIELADDSYKRETGLMYRKKMGDIQGMLFIFPDEKPRPYFYMKNTYIGLDLIYINTAGKVVDINENAKPLDETLIPSDAPAKYVLEINAGKAKEWNLQIGDNVVIKK